MDAEYCNMCEKDHALNMPHPDPIHPGPRTRRVRIAVVLYEKDMVSSNWSRRPECDADAMALSSCQTIFGAIIGRAYVDCDIPVDAVPVVQGWPVVVKDRAEILACFDKRKAGAP